MHLRWVAAVLLFSNTAWAQVYGIGSQSCGEFVEAVEGSQSNLADEGDRYAFVSWAQGYLSAYNALARSESLGSTDRAGLQLWLYDYCRVHQLESFNIAVNALIDELRPHRPL